MTFILSIVYRKCRKEGGVLLFVDDKKIEIEVKESDFYIIEKYGGDIFDNLDEEGSEKVDLYKKENNSKYSEIQKIINTKSQANYMWDNNDLRDLKKYIYKVLNIPVESQYLESVDEYGEFSSTCHYYKYIDPSLRNIKIRPRIQSVISKDEDIEDKLIEGLNMDYEIYYSRPSFFIKENYKKIRTLMAKNSSEIHLYDLRDIIDVSTEGNSYILTNKLKDTDNMNMFYHGFVEKFYPLIQLTNVSLYLNEKNIHSEYPFLANNDIDIKNNIIKYINSKSKKYLKSIESKGSDFQYIKLAYRKNSNVIIHILKLYNSLDLNENVVKIKAYISHKNILLEKVKPYELEKSRKTKLPDSIKKEIKSYGLSYLTIYYSKNIKSARVSEVTIFSNGDVSCLAMNDNLYRSADAIKKDFISSSLRKIYEWLEKQLMDDVELYFNFASIKQFCEIESVGVQQVINTQPDVNTASYLQSLFRELEVLEEYKVSSSESIKDSILLFSSRRSRAILKLSLNDFHDYLEQKSSSLPEFFSKQNIQIHLRLNDILVSYNNINIKDYQSYFNLCNVVIDMYSELRNKSKPEEELYFTGSKRIKMLKQADPLLFNTDSIDKENKYSRLCQSKQQPLIISKEASNSRKYKTRSVKFWNFTKGVPEYYVCDSEQYPYLKFITGNHPKNFCLPCCKKKMVDSNEDSASTYKDRHDVCLSKYIYEKKSTNVEQTTNRYISLYSCKLDLEENRLMKLSPTIKKLIRPPSGDTAFFIYGVSPFSSIIESYILKMVSLQRFNNSNSSVDVLLSIIEIIDERKDLIYQLADGQIFANFSSSDKLVEFLYSCAEGGVKVESWGEWVNWIDWDSVFIEILNLFSDIAILEIIETDNNTINDSNIDINLSRDMLIKNEYLILFKRTTASGDIVRYPLAEINLSEFYTDYSIRKISFSSTHKIINSIKSVMSIANKESPLNFAMDTAWLIDCSNSSNISIDCVFVNHMKIVYAVLINVRGSKTLVHTEYINFLKASEIMKSVGVILKSKENITSGDVAECNMNGVLQFCKYFGMKVKELFVNENSITSGIIQKEDIDIEYFFRLKGERVSENNKYNIRYIGESLDNINKGGEWSDVKDSLYNVNLYDILLLHVNNKLSKKVNFGVRDRVKSIFIENIKNLYGSNTTAELNACFSHLQKIVSSDDSHRIVYGFVNSFREQSTKISKLKIVDAVLDSLSFLSLDRFEFDSRLDNVTTESVREFLSDIVTISDVNRDMDFDLNLGVCSKRNSYYCDSGKYIIPQSEYKEIIDVLVKDLTNDYKKKYILQYNDIHIKNSGLESGLYIKQYKNSNTLIYEL